MSVVKYKYFSLLEIYYKHTLYITDGSKRIFSLLQIRLLFQSKDLSARNLSLPTLRTILFPTMHILVRSCCFFFSLPLSLFFLSKRKKKKKIYSRVNALWWEGDLFLMRARMALVTRDERRPGTGSASATAPRPREKTMKRKPQEVELDLGAGQIRLGLFVMLHLCSANGVAF